VLSPLGLATKELRGLSVYKRSYDARRRGAVQLIYALDLDVLDPAALLDRFAAMRTSGRARTPLTTFVAGRRRTSALRRW
jgi:hypothetical protein